MISPCSSMSGRWRGNKPWSIPGEDYPSGGAATTMLDIYRVVHTAHRPDCTGHLHFKSQTLTRPCALSMLATTILFSHLNPPGSPNLLRAIADYNAIGYFALIQPIFAKDGSTDPTFDRCHQGSVRCVAAVIPLLLKYPRVQARSTP